MLSVHGPSPIAFLPPPPPSVVEPLEPPLDDPPLDEPPLDDAVPELLAVPLLLPPLELDDEVDSSSLQALMAMMAPAMNVTEPLRVNFIAQNISERDYARTLHPLQVRHWQDVLQVVVMQT